MHIKPRTLVIWGAGLALLVGFFAYTFAPRPVPVDLALTTHGDMQITVDADGKTRIRQVYEVAAPVGGLAQRSPVAVGDRVLAGISIVARVEPIAPGLLDARSRIQAEAAVREAEAALNVAKTQVASAGADLAYAEIQYERARTLAERGVASTSHLEAADQNLTARQAALEAAKAQRDMASGALERIRAALIETNGSGADTSCCIEIFAPATGAVLEITNISERPVSAGTPLLRIGDRDDLEIIADLLSSEAVGLKVGADAVLERWGGEGILRARLRSVEPSGFTKVSALGIEEQRVNVILDLLDPVSARPGLGDGFAVLVRIVEWQARDVLQVPISALFRHQDGWAVFVVADDRATLRPLSIGRRNGRFAEVRTGLEAGEAVITHPSDRIADGVAVVDRTGI